MNDWPPEADFSPIAAGSKMHVISDGRAVCGAAGAPTWIVTADARAIRVNHRDVCQRCRSRLDRLAA